MNPIPSSMLRWKDGTVAENFRLKNRCHLVYHQKKMLARARSCQAMPAKKAKSP
jgi:hypothetical protein